MSAGVVCARESSIGGVPGQPCFKDMQLDYKCSLGSGLVIFERFRQGLDIGVVISGSRLSACGVDDYYIQQNRSRTVSQLYRTHINPALLKVQKTSKKICQVHSNVLHAGPGSNKLCSSVDISVGELARVASRGSRAVVFRALRRSFFGTVSSSSLSNRSRWQIAQGRSVV